MKNLIKLITAITAVTFLFSTNVKAQTAPGPWRLGVGLETGIPTGGGAGSSTFELGGTVRLQYRVNKTLTFTLTPGYYNFFNATGYYITSTGIVSRKISLGYIPVKAGAKIYFLSKVYVGAEGGVAIPTSSGGNPLPDASAGIGYSTKSWEIGARYENFFDHGSNFGLVGLRIAYGFGL